MNIFIATKRFLSMFLAVTAMAFAAVSFSDDIVVGSIESEIEDEVEQQVQDQVEEQVEEQVDESVAEQIDDQVDEQVEDIVVGGIQRDVDSQVDEQIEETVDDQIEEQVEEQVAAVSEEQVDQRVEEQIEDEIEEQIDTDVETQVDDEVDQQIASSIEEQVDEEVAQQVDNALEDQVSDSIDEQVATELDDQIAAEVDAQVASEVDEQVEQNVQESVASTVDDQVEQMVAESVASSVEPDFDDLDVLDFNSADIDRYVEAYIEPKVPEAILVLAPQSAIIEAEKLGLELESRDVLGNLGMILGKISPYEARRIARSDPELSKQLERLDSDKNHLYRQYALSSDDEDDELSQTSAATPADLVRELGFSAPLKVDASVGMIDSSVNMDHPCLRGQAVTQNSLIPADQKPSQGHGTAVAAILAGSQQCESAGLLENARLFNASVFYDDGSGEPVADAASLLMGIDWLLGQHVSVINMSFSGPPNKLLERAIDVLAKRGVPVFAAVGNEGPLAPPRYPAAYPNTIGVTAVDRQHNVYRMAGRGKHVTLAAPGVHVRVAAADGSGVQSGTSLAAPMAAAFYLGETHSAQDNADNALNLLRNNAIDLGNAGPDETYGHGLVNLKLTETATLERTASR